MLFCYNQVKQKLQSCYKHYYAVIINFTVLRIKEIKKDETYFINPYSFIILF